MSEPVRAGLLQRAECVAQVLVDDLDAPILSEADLAHIGKVLRARPGELVSMIDGSGRWRIGEWRDGVVAPSDAIEAEPEPDSRVTVCFALIKGDRPELCVQKLTEIGADRIVLLTKPDHAVVRWDAQKQEKNLVRLRRVAHEAAMQSRRVRIPSVECVERVDDLPDGTRLAHPGGEPLSEAGSAIAVGPEGGWSDRELTLGLATVDLGPTILRAETASIAVCVQLCALRRFM